MRKIIEFQGYYFSVLYYLQARIKYKQTILIKLNGIQYFLANIFSYQLSYQVLDFFKDFLLHKKTKLHLYPDREL